MTSITLSQEVKDELEALKPGSLTWDEYLHLLVTSIDPDRFEEALEAFFQSEYEASVRRARERYAKARSDPSILLDADEARQRVRELRDDG